MSFTPDCIIFAGADIENIDSIRDYLTNDTYCICADSGLRHARAFGIVPDMLVGDFDSVDPPSDFSGEVITFPAQKNDTDLFIAASIALQRGFKSVAILGAFGGRPDHTFGAVSVLEYLDRCAVAAVIVSDNGEIRFLREKTVYKFKKDNSYKYFSVIPLDSNIFGITLKGFKYPLENADAKRWETLCISNEIVADFGEVYIDKGSALGVLSCDISNKSRP